MLGFRERDLVFPLLIIFMYLQGFLGEGENVRARSKRLPVAYIDSSTSWFALSFHVSI